MGSNTSKSISETTVHEQKNDLDINTNPDPRSPTPEITRTPLQVFILNHGSVYRKLTIYSQF